MDRNCDIISLSGPSAQGREIFGDEESERASYFVVLTSQPGPRGKHFDSISSSNESSFIDSLSMTVVWLLMTSKYGKRERNREVNLGG